MKQLTEQIIELRQNYNELGEDLVLLESVVTALQTGCEFPAEYVDSSLKRIIDYIRQHTGELRNISEFLQKTVVRSNFVV